jgi:hypothetical protein
MPRYMIERTFPNGLALSPNAEGKKAAGSFSPAVPDLATAPAIVQTLA